MPRAPAAARPIAGEHLQQLGPADRRADFDAGAETQSVFDVFDLLVETSRRNLSLLHVTTQSEQRIKPSGERGSRDSRIVRCSRGFAVGYVVALGREPKLFRSEDFVSPTASFLDQPFPELGVDDAISLQRAESI